jgi:hypothetical protein
MLDCIQIWYIDNKDNLMKRIWVSLGTSACHILTAETFKMDVVMTQL